MRHILTAATGLAIAFNLTVLPAPDAAAQEVTREITQISGDLYRFQNNFHYSVFLVTDQGVIATDPIDADAAQWLQDEIQSRFNQPIVYAIYSHSHGDHVSGGEVWADAGATVIAHEYAKAAIVRDNGATAVPTITFSDRMTVELGGKQVELSYLGKSHSNNLIVMNFPDERTLFTVDFISVNRLPYQTLNGAFFPDWMEAIQQVEAMDFDILAPGHGSLGNKADATAHREYLEALYSQVQQAAAEGKTVDEMKAEILLEDYSDWSQYEDWRTMNIEGMAGYMQ